MVSIVNTKCNEVVIKFEGDRLVHCSKMLTGFFKLFGISIPPGELKNFNDRRIVPFPKDGDSNEVHALFKKAFLEVYYPNDLGNNFSMITDKSN